MKEKLHGKMVVFTLITVSVMFICIPVLARAQTKLDDYTFSGLYTTLYGLDTFSTNGTTEVVLNYRQWTDYPTDAWVEYAIVIKGTFSDTVYSSFQIKGSNSDVGKQKSFDIVQQGSDRRIRIANLGAQRSNGYGEIYQQ